MTLPSTLVRLKLRLLVNRTRSQRGGVANVVVGVLAAFFGGVFGFAILSASANFDDPADRRALLVLGAATLLVAWTLGPLFTFGTDETLDPARLVLYPLRRGPMMRGLLAASLIGFAPAGVAIALAGVVAGYGRGSGLPVVVLAAALLFVLCAATARMVTTLLAARLSSRRGRDLTLIIAAFFGLAVQGLRFVDFTTIDPALVARVTRVVQWTPPGMLGRSIIDANEGHIGQALAWLLVPAALIPVFLTVWGRALDRAMTVVPGGQTKPVEMAGRSSRLPLFPPYAAFLPDSAAGAVAAKELRAAARDPRRKVVLLQAVVIGLGGGVLLGLRAGSSLGEGTVLAAGAVGYLALVGAMNQFGLDGAALWMDVAAGNRMRDEFVGRNLALLIEMLPIVALSALLLAAFTGGWLYVPTALVIGTAGLGVGLAVANGVSVRYPFPVPETRSPFAGRGPGTGCTTGLMLMMASFVQAALLAPIAIGATVAAVVGPALGVIVAPAAAAYGWLIWRAGVSNAERYVWWRQPELLAAVDPGRSSAA